MAKRLVKIPQPPIDPAGRSTEARHIVLGIVGALVGAVLIAAAFLTSHRLGAESVRQPQLVELVTHGGVAISEERTPVTGPAGQAEGQTATTTIKKVEKPPEDCPT